MSRLMPILLLLVFASGCSIINGERAAMRQYMGNGEKRFQIVERLDGTWVGNEIVLRRDDRKDAIRILAVDRHPTTQLTDDQPGGIRMVLAFQLEEGKTREDFQAFKEIDLSWVSANRGRNHATVWTERSPQWPFDAFDDTTFATVDDFWVAYEGNPAILEAAEGLFGPQVFVGIISVKED